MKIDRVIATRLLLESEGPELNIGGSEPGGASRYGISVDALTSHNARHGRRPATVEDIRQMTEEFAGAIYNEDFADVIRFDELPAGVDYVMLNNCANLGVHGGVSLARAVFGFWQDGSVVDDALLTAIKSLSAEIAVRMLGAAWIAKKHESRNWYPSAITRTGYGHGWTVRYLRVDRDARKMIS